MARVKSYRPNPKRTVRVRRLAPMIVYDPDETESESESESDDMVSVIMVSESESESEQLPLALECNICMDDVIRRKQVACRQCVFITCLSCYNKMVRSTSQCAMCKHPLLDSLDIEFISIDLT